MNWPVFKASRQHVCTCVIVNLPRNIAGSRVKSQWLCCFAVCLHFRNSSCRTFMKLCSIVLNCMCSHRYWASVPIPHGCLGFRAACPFCATPLTGDPGWVKLIFQDHVDWWLVTRLITNYLWCSDALCLEPSVCRQMSSRRPPGIVWWVVHVMLQKQKESLSSVATPPVWESHRQTVDRDVNFICLLFVDGMPAEL